MTKYQRVFHIFRRDLRIDDNTALLSAHEQSREVLPIFIFDPRQIEEHPYRSLPALQFLLEALGDLDKQISARNGVFKLYYGDPIKVLREAIVKEQVEALFFNRDYTPFSRNRDRQLKELCEELNIKIHQYGDALLHEPEVVEKQGGGPYTIYTPFMKRASCIAVREPQSHKVKNFGVFKVTEKNTQILSQIPQVDNERAFVHGKRSLGLSILDNLIRFKNYATERDLPAKEATTGLSAYLKFGLYSAREVYWKVRESLGRDHLLIRELFWRDFFHHIAFHFPHVFRGCFHKQYDEIEWENNQEWFAAWCEGRTGFPIVDAGMRQLNQTGFMHNRVRMIVASFLVKDLLIDWRWGEKYFAQKLIDYDPSVNNGNWQWAASTGCDAQPYFRIFNPWLQQERFDGVAEYIKKWVQELENCSGKDLLKYGEATAPISGYVLPLIEHAAQKNSALRMFEAISNKS